MSRAREVRIRKVYGAVKHQIFTQFIGESILISLLSLAIAIGILQFLQPAFKSLWVTRFIRIDMAGDIHVYLLFLAFSILIGMTAGIIPALFLSSLKALKVLKNIQGISGSPVVLTIGGTSYTFLKSVNIPEDSTGMAEVINNLWLRSWYL